MKAFWVIFTSVIVLLVCLCCVCFVSFCGLMVYLAETDVSYSNTPFSPAATPMVIRPQTATPAPITRPTAEEPLELSGTPTTKDMPTAVPLPVVESVSDETLNTLNDTIVPANDWLALASRLGGKGPVSPTVEPAPEYFIGDRLKFWVTNVDTNMNTQVDTVLRYKTDHAYFWIEDGVDYDESDLSTLAETFENEIYPTDREFFGSEWTPGVDGDVHLYIVYATDLGYSLAGYFSAADSYPPEANEYSNGHETFMFNADNMGLGDIDTASTLAHEFQHMIHWNGDRNETSWLNEGFSVLAEFLMDYPTWFDSLYIQDTDLQLTDWPTDSSQSPPHYGAGFLFTDYFLDRFGENATKLLVSEPANGMESVDIVLDQINAVDELTGQPYNAEDLFTDWTIANYLQDGSVGDGRYVYHNYPGAPQADATETIKNCDGDLNVRDVHQFGADYINITCSGDYTLHFEGSVLVNLLPEGAYSGEYAFWSNKGDESDMTLTQAFDFSDVDGPLTFNYQMWHDLEEDYDYAYLVASTDGGDTWQILDTPTCTTYDPSGNSYGCAWNGMSGGRNQAQWIDESVDISQFAGEIVLLRFEYITDAAVNGEGLMLDDIAIPEIGYFSDFEKDDGGWQAEGFARVTNILPQHFRLALIEHGSDTSVRYIDLDETVAADIPFTIGEGVKSVTLVVNGTTPYTRQKAAYQFSIEP